MALNLTLKPFERFVVNGCMMRNGGRKSTITVENRADIIRETDLLKPDAASTPVRIVYFLIQNALIEPARRERLLKEIQTRLAELVPVFGSELRSHVFEAANNVSKGEYFTALRDLRPLMKREDEVFGPQQSELVDA
ncbi:MULTISPECIES: flagellar biosynthesis repressor FlbT [Salipiger]|uniref:FlbT protein n=1 Tax=Salipiger bermudensis (strain DSM 26914 / JCM 13377 / KCTC 12554 / HTCC2601) TaxID=314265 RepID=Q0FMH8_SALBH|nr:flagellar biosynthesis repressor FlbT [Salipiger bermudensis]MAE92378.1 flagellum biosynthesis protein FlbT [Pelagibaca sp.]MBR9893237.1 flagellum biosynthesis protein FlbT [bacterium]EAU45420.1 flbT protein [Salipiger bermudensis HTCC2601]MBN9677811.1 flagellar biosynthesis repressor FlbT [Salipiger bermudensis]MCA1287757.1 flagellar biosynthesis repressor FlbT [Salipiger bermudensis]